MTNRIEGNKETVYTYDLDRLIQIEEKENGVTTSTQTLTYDNAGNLITDEEFTYTWQMGRQLQGITGTDLTTSYKYNENGLRTQKTVNGQTHEYTLLGSSVTREVIRDNEGNILWTIHYSYAGEGTPVSMNVNGTEYYYLKNAQGDITHIVDGDGNEVASYEYDAWGNHLSITGGDIAQLNPYRYRGYRYDSETGLYYVSSRYYDPETCRFINADSQLNIGEGVLGCNMYTYCLNNPVNGYDPCGTCFHRWDFWNDCDKCGGKNLGTKIGDAASAVGGAVVSAGKAVGNAVVSAGKAVGNAVVTAGQAIGNAAAAAWDWTKGAAQTAWGGIKTAGKAVREFVADRFSTPEKASNTLSAIAWTLDAAAAYCGGVAAGLSVPTLGMSIPTAGTAAAILVIASMPFHGAALVIEIFNEE